MTGAGSALTVPATTAWASAATGATGAVVTGDGAVVVEGGTVVVVVVVGGMGSLSGAFLASLLIGVIQTFAVAIDYSFLAFARDVGWQLSAATQDNSFAKLTVSQVAPILPYLFLVLILIFRPNGLSRGRELVLPSGRPAPAAPAGLSPRPEAAS